MPAINSQDLNNQFWYSSNFIFSFMMSNFSLQLETALIYLLGCLSMLLRNIVVQSLCNTANIKEWRLFWFDLFSVVFPMFLMQTFLTDYLIFFFVCQCMLLAIAFMFCGVRSGATPLRALRPLRVDSNRALRDSHTMFRALLLLTTALAILAVDFSLFPRRLAKTHYYGQSLMDTGTAAFVFVNALADQNAESRGQSPRERTLKGTMQLFFIRIPTLIVIFLLGIGRSLFINFSGYNQDVTEYGVHWNFFVTLLFIRLYVVIVPSSLIVPMGFLLGSAYQIALMYTGMEQWILGTFYTRQGFIDQNREGIFSLFGYFFIYSASLLYARFSSSFIQKERRLPPTRVFCLFGIGLFAYCAQKILENYVGLLASRRLANLPYCFAMIALFSTTTTFLQIIQLVVPFPRSKGGLIEAVSRNALLHFLVANLLTGFVNISMHFVKIRGKMLETVAMFAYTIVASALIFAIYLGKKRSHN